MKLKTHLIPVLCLCFGIILLNSCKRNGVQEPNPFGPATFSILLNMGAAPNVIFAGDTRESTTITATLQRFDGTPIANTFIHFDIKDVTGNRANIGFFEGNESVATKTTDPNGRVSINYYGPFSYELTDDAMIYISASAAWEEDEFITELAPVYLIREALDLTFTFIADPNVLLTSENRPTSQLKAYLKTVDGVPLAGRKIFFTVIAGPGFFANTADRTVAITDANGFAVVTYFGPTKYEIGVDQFATIKGQPETTTPFYIHSEVDIRLLRND